MYGIDYAWSHPPVAAMKAAGVRFVCRYMSNDPSKDIGASELKALLAAGIDVALVWESAAGRMKGGHAAGADDATRANARVKSLGMPHIPVYFAADWDVTPAQQAQVNDYLDGAASVIGLKRTGLYGGYWPVSRARAAKKASYFWGTIAWSGSNWKTASWKPHIMQSVFVNLGGVVCDVDHSHADDFGQWPRPETLPAMIKADGKASFKTLSAKYHVRISSMLRHTLAVSPGRLFTPGLSDHLQGADLSLPIPAGETIRLRKS